MDPEAGWFGDRAVLVRLPSRPVREAVVAALTAALPGHEVRAGTDAVLVEGPDPDVALLDVVRAALAVPSTDRPDRPDAVAERSVVIDVRYDGADLGIVAAALGCTPAEVISAHVAQEWRVGFVGFAPGFGYLEPMAPVQRDWEAVARRESPRTRVPKGAVAVAAGRTAVYPRAMPGGWLLIGTSDVVLFDETADDDPSLLHPGDRVRFADHTSSAS